MLIDFLRLSLSNLWRHRARSLLTALGIIIGVAAVVCMAGYGEGSKRAEIASIQALGARNILLTSVKPPLSSAPAEGGEPAKAGRITAYGLTDLDVRRILAPEAGPVEHAVPMQRTGSFIYRGPLQFPQAEAWGTLPELAHVTPLAVERGRFLCGTDGRLLKNVAVLGDALAAQLFPLEDPLGGCFEIDGQSFSVVGVLSAESRAAGEPTHFCAYLPLETARARFGPARMDPQTGAGDQVEVGRLIVRVPDNADPAEVSARIRRVVDHAHAAAGDVDVRVPKELIRQKENARRIFTVLMVLIAGLSLLVGGIGIMNIMLASVVERTREIGVRRALGATRRQIGAQFLIETTTLSGIGGILGVLLGLLGCGVITWLSGKVGWLNPAIPEPVPVLVSFAVSTGVGIVFGMYPALRAAAQDPVVALRHD